MSRQETRFHKYIIRYYSFRTICLPHTFILIDHSDIDNKYRYIFEFFFDDRLNVMIDKVFRYAQRILLFFFFPRYLILANDILILLDSIFFGASSFLSHLLENKSSIEKTLRFVMLFIDRGF